MAEQCRPALKRPCGLVRAPTFLPSPRSTSHSVQLNVQVVVELQVQVDGDSDSNTQECH